MDKKVILAVAGSGKTYHICHSIDIAKRTLILAFTNENIHNIRNELFDAYGEVPNTVTVMTFDSFVYRYIILPFEPTIADHFKVPFFYSKGITTIAPPPQRIKQKDRYIINPMYIKQDKIGHYMTKQNRYYCDTLSELSVKIKNGKESLIKRAASRINLFYNLLLIDEFQDFREYDYELITTLSKYLRKVILVGDFYQHSVSGTNNSGKPFKNQKGDVSYSDFVDQLKKQKFIVDESSLRTSRRCSEEVCTYITQKLCISIESSKANKGSVIWINVKCYTERAVDKHPKIW